MTRKRAECPEDECERTLRPQRYRRPWNTENGSASVARFITVTSTQRGTFSRRDVAVLQKESSPFPLKRQPEKAEDEEDVKEATKWRRWTSDRDSRRQR